MYNVFCYVISGTGIGIGQTTVVPAASVSHGIVSTLAMLSHLQRL